MNGIRTGRKCGQRRGLQTIGALVVLCLFSPGAAGAQQIYRWTDANGKVHFGNQPPAGANAESRSGNRSEIESECEAAVKGKCQEYVSKYGKWQSSKSYRECVERGREQCERLRPQVKATPAPERFVSTPTLPFDPGAGESLRCEMRCPNKCRGQVEIRSDRVLKKGENYGIDHYSMEVKPTLAGSAFCSVSTPSRDVQLVFSVLSAGVVKSVVEGQ